MSRKGEQCVRKGKHTKKNMRDLRRAEKCMFVKIQSAEGKKIMWYSINCRSEEYRR
jgi:hypothetical protein